MKHPRIKLSAPASGLGVGIIPPLMPYTPLPAPPAKELGTAVNTAAALAVAGASVRVTTSWFAAVGGAASAGLLSELVDNIGVEGDFMNPATVISCLMDLF